MGEKIMPEIKITKKVTNGHQHVIYLRDNGQGIGSESAGHTPIVQLAAFQDPATGELRDMWFVVDPNGYRHELTEITLIETKKEKKDSEIVTEVLEDFVECYDYEKDSRLSAIEAEQIYSHDPKWHEKIKPEDDNRAFSPVNIVEDKIDMLTGYQKQNRTEIHYLPSEKGDGFGADVLNVVVKKILNVCYYQREKSKVFEDQAVCGRGLLNVYEDYNADLDGRIVVERFPHGDAYFGPHEKDDASDCEVMFKTKWYSEDSIRSEFDNLLKKRIGEDEKELETSLEPSEDWDERLNTMNLVDKNAKKYRLLERWKKEFKRSEVLVFPEDTFVLNPVGWDVKTIAAAKTITGMSTVKRKTSRMKITRIVSTIFLEEEYLTYQNDAGEIVNEDYLEIIPAYGKKIGGRWWSKIEGIKDLQVLVIKTFGLFVDLLAQIKNGATYYDSETFDDVKEAERFKKEVTTPGYIGKVADLTKIPKRDEGIRFPNEVVNAIQMISQMAREIFNVNLGMQGGGQESSGVLLKQKIVQQLIGNDFLFDNLRFSEQVLAKVLIKKIQKLYTPERLLRILSHENNQVKKNKPDSRGVEIGGKPLDEYPIDQLKEMLRTVNLSEMDVDVGEAPDSPSAMMGAFLMLLEASKTGTPIPPDMFINLYPLPEGLKRELMQSLQAAQQAEAQKDQQKYSTEIEKVKIAQQSKMMDKNPMQQMGGGMPV
jgi:hypothetical protein